MASAHESSGFNDFDEKSCYEKSVANLLRPETSNLVVKFDIESALVASNLGADGILNSLRVEVSSPRVFRPFSTLFRCPLR